MDAFALSITVIPRSSIPGGAPYAARGVWKSKPTVISLGTGGYESSTQPTMGIRVSEFAAPPHRDDIIQIADPLAPPDASGNWTIADTNPDGQGGMELTLKKRVQAL